MLTKKQLDLLTYIDETLREGGVAPSYDEMKAHMGIKSKSGIHHLVRVLEERHFIRRLPGHARAMQVLMIPDKAPHMTAVSNDNLKAIPLYGKIAAGLPIEAVNTNMETIFAPAQLTGRGEHYALIVEGDSMKDAGIMDGDTVIIQKAARAPDGAIVVALIDEYEVTLKRLHTRGETIALEPANPAYETRIFGPGRVEIQGILVGLMRSY